MDCKQHNIAIKSALSKSGLKATKARFCLLDVFQHAGKPLTIKETENRLGEGAADLATIYRNVESLIRAGVLREVVINSKKGYYELAGGKHHHHLICECCGKVRDVEACGLDALQNQILKQENFFAIKRHSLEFFGVCQPCSKKQ